MSARPFRILVVDDDKASRDLMVKVLAQVLPPGNHSIEPLADGTEAILETTHVHSKAPIDLVVSDMRMVEADGLQVLKAFRKESPETPVILVTAFGNVDGAVDAIRQGAFDYLSKPYDVDQIKIVISRALQQKRLAEENRTLRREAREKYRLENIVGRSDAMLQVYKTAARVAGSEATVMIMGESGSGKELVARAIHQASPRAQGPFVAVDCGALSEGILESELFGHAKGAFTGAQGARRGLFEEASSGTLFLDEVGNVSPKLQAQLLRVLQEGEIRPVGANEPIKVDVRVVAATNRDLSKAIAAGEFREDLFYRLNVVSIRIPPLRERVEDIPLLAEHFVHKHGRSETASLSPEARQVLMAYTWPGNVRELENAISRSLALNPAGVILPEDLPAHIRSPPAAAQAAGSAAAKGSTGQLWADRPTLAILERRYAQLVLQECAGNKSKTAELLAIDRKTLTRLLMSDAAPQKPAPLAGLVTPGKVGES